MTYADAEQEFAPQPRLSLQFCVVVASMVGEYCNARAIKDEKPQSFFKGKGEPFYV